MSKAPPPLLGFNNNVRHRGRIFHIQTEDSGVKFQRIVTHLFADGGRIVKTTRTEYTEHVAREDMATVVRGMMKEQHKAMFAALRAGELDPLLENVCGPLSPAASLAPAEPDSSSQLEAAPSAPHLVAATAAPPVRSPSSASLERVEPSRVPATLTEPAVEVPGPVAESRPPDSESISQRGSNLSNPNLRAPTSSITPPAPEAFDLDVASLDRLPPPKSSPPSRLGAPRSPSSTRLSRPAQRPTLGADPNAPGALGRPATRFAAVPQKAARSIFGDGAISEQSLDEVILSYLAEDLEEPK